jgi:putative ABC transport system substrate-binding protein
VRRRHVLEVLLGSTIVLSGYCSPHAEEQRRRVIGILGAQSASTQGELWAGFVKQLQSLGWSEDRNITIDFEWADARPERFAEIAAEFARRNVDIIVTSSTPTVIAAKKTTSTIPIVFTNASDPVANGLVSSLSHPNGNATGLSTQLADTTGKRLGFFREVVHRLRCLAVVFSSNDPAAANEAREVSSVAEGLGMAIVQLDVGHPDELATKVESVKNRADGLYFCNTNLFNTLRPQIVSLVAAAGLPAVYDSNGFVKLGGLMSYGPNGPALFKRAADLVDKILRGTRPQDIPVEQPTEFTFAVNLKAAKALGVEIPEELVHTADLVVE